MVQSKHKHNLQIALDNLSLNALVKQQSKETKTTSQTDIDESKISLKTK